MEDPLRDLAGVSLIARSTGIPPSALKSTDSDDHESIHEFTKSMKLRSPEKYFEQARSTLDRNREHANPEFVSFVTVNNEQETGEIVRGRRPGLGHKKAQFTMIPNLSQPPLSSERVRDAELSKDPIEFFEYLERREMAEKELSRLRGENISDVIDFSLPITERRRRPGLLGRTATYKHLYPSSTLPQNNDTIMPSQDIVEEVLLSPVNHTPQPKAVDSCVELEKKLTGSIAMSESKISTLFDELLGLENLDSYGISSLVLKRLQIKPTIMNEIPIPVFQDSRMNKKSRTALSDKQNLDQTVGGNAVSKIKQLAKNIFQSLASSRPSISQLAPLSAFQKHIQQSNRSNDRFSAVDPSPHRNYSSFVDVDEQSNHLGTGKELMASSTTELKSMLPEVDDSTVGNLVTVEMVGGRSEPQHDKSVKDQFSIYEVSNMIARSTDADFRVDVGNEIVENIQVVDVGEDAAPSVQVNANVENSSIIHTDYQTAGSDEIGENVVIMSRNAELFINGDLPVERMKSKGNATDRISPAAGGSSYSAAVNSVQHTLHAEEPSKVHTNDKITSEIPSGSGCKRKEVCHSENLEMPLNDQSKAEVPPRKVSKSKETEEPLVVPLNYQAKGVPPKRSRKKKAFSSRHSLAAAGSHWEEGTRKSNRIKMRPLEYWRGERFLYGRVHESLTTVIGLKYASPEKDAEHRFGEKRNMKVKSYVSGEYEELVKRVSLY